MKNYIERTLLNVRSLPLPCLKVKVRVNVRMWLVNENSTRDRNQVHKVLRRENAFKPENVTMSLFKSGNPFKCENALKKNPKIIVPSNTQELF